ncbi:hypothetical protein V8F20_000271 [Naviculisporaceae sp. PSN 640]
MPVNIKAEPGSEERGLPPPRPAGGRSRTRPSADDDDFEEYEPETPQVPARRAPAKKKTPASAPKKAAEKEWNYSYMPASTEQRKKNGRVEGRNLITWNRPRMAEKLLLHIMYECSRHRVEIPWDQVAHRLHPGSTGGAIVQHLNRLRGTLIAEGHLVPPICQKPGSRVVVDPHIRGYIRKFPETDDTTTTREVRFDEPMEDRRFNLPDAYDTLRGNQIRYDAPSPGLRRPPATPTTPSTGPDLSTPVLPSSTAATRGTPAKRGRGGKKPSADRGIKREPSPDPALLDSDEDYSPGPKPPRKQARRTGRPIKPRMGSYVIDDDDEDELMEEEILPKKIPRKQLEQQRAAAATSSNRKVVNEYIEIEDDMPEALDASHSQSMGKPDQHGFLSGGDAHTLAQPKYAQQLQATKVQHASNLQQAAQIQQAQMHSAQMQHLQLQQGLSRGYMSGANEDYATLNSFGPIISGGNGNGISSNLAHSLSAGDNNNNGSASLSFDNHFSSPVGDITNRSLASGAGTPTGLRYLSSNPMLSEDAYFNHEETLEMSKGTNSVSVSAQSNTNAAHTQRQSPGSSHAVADAGSAEADSTEGPGNAINGDNATSTVDGML